METPMIWYPPINYAEHMAAEFVLSYDAGRETDIHLYMKFKTLLNLIAEARENADSQKEREKGGAYKQACPNCTCGGHGHDE